jgi:hypothetical protein
VKMQALVTHDLTEQRLRLNDGVGSTHPPFQVN